MLCLKKMTEKISFICSHCSLISLQWSGQCGHCGAWNSLTETKIGKQRKRTKGQSANVVSTLSNIPRSTLSRLPTNIGELDRVLGGGVVPGSVILLGGDPGIGKSTLALQWVASQFREMRSLYVSGEESLQQLALRAERLGVNKLAIDAVSQNDIGTIVDLLPDYEFVVIDSIQSLHCQNISSQAGSVAQVREAAERLTRCAKDYGCSILFIGHVTKEGSLAGPKILEHMVDTVLYFEGDDASRFRIVRSFKNRFGGVNEIGVFVMTEEGLREINNPSSLFLSGRQKNASGSVVLVTQQGTRPLLVEVQALLDKTSLGNPRRLCVGLDPQRLVLLLAVLQRHGGVPLSGYDIFVNVAGGIRVIESGSDVAVGAAILSSLLDKSFPTDTACFGEVGLAGEIRPVQRAQDRLHELGKLGFKRVLIPKANDVSDKISGLEVIQLKRIEDLVSWLS